MTPVILSWAGQCWMIGESILGLGATAWPRHQPNTWSSSELSTWNNFHHQTSQIFSHSSPGIFWSRLVYPGELSHRCSDSWHRDTSSPCTPAPPRAGTSPPRPRRSSPTSRAWPAGLGPGSRSAGLCWSTPHCRRCRVSQSLVDWSPSITPQQELRQTHIPQRTLSYLSCLIIDDDIMNLDQYLSPETDSCAGSWSDVMISGRSDWEQCSMSWWGWRRLWRGWSVSVIRRASETSLSSLLLLSLITS